MTSSPPPPSRRPPGGFSTLSLEHAEHTRSRESQTSQRASQSNVVFGDDVSAAAWRPQSTSISTSVSTSSCATPTRFARTPRQGSLSGIFENTESGAGPASRQGSAGVASVGNNQLVTRPGRRPGPRRESAPVFGSAADAIAPGRRHPVGVSPNLKSSFKLVYTDSEIALESSSEQPKRAGNNNAVTDSDIPAAGRRNVFATHNIINPPTTPETQIRPASAMAMHYKHKSNIQFGSPSLSSSNVSEASRPQKRPGSASGNKTSIVFGDDGGPSLCINKPSSIPLYKSRFNGLYNKSNVVFGDDGGRNTSSPSPPPHSSSSITSRSSRIPIASANSGAFNVEKAPVSQTETFAEFVGAVSSNGNISSSLPSSVKPARVDPSVVASPAGMPSGKHRIF
ncbi:hypothetical protein BDR26DRAFT_890851 [Obelidium mucronatum]|nr:hypothetical protein BDR26DRAFT_890851 [Obelidium mucronatum]